MNRISDETFAHRLTFAELEYLGQLRASARSFAGNYVGLDFA